MSPTTLPTHVAELRRRADRLVRLAAEIDRGIATVADAVDALGREAGHRERIPTDALLERSLHQLHRSADQLRDTARRCRQRADDLNDSVADGSGSAA